jgi:2-dehydropantoate 2-reductase
MERVFESCWIIGVGAIGSVLAAAMAQQGRIDTFLVGQSAHARAIRENGLEFRIHNESASHIQIPTITPQEVPFLNERHLVLLTQKVPALADTAVWLRSCSQKGTGIIALQNGIGVEQFIAKTFGRAVDRGLIFFGANSQQPGEVQYYPGKIRLRPSAVTQAFAKLMEDGLVPCQLSSDFRTTEWWKLAINCIANPLAGILGINNRRITQAVLDPAKEAILKEVCEVALAESVSIDVTAQDINRYLAMDNTPSLQADLERHYPTEIDFLNGAVVRLAKKHGIFTPANSLVVSLVKFLEQHT